MSVALSVNTVMTVNPAKIAEPMNMQSYRIEWAQETIPHK